ncbi:hypothetical protein BJ508DRAFT_309483 [Ascobolus immersus RN42]|uniref:Uncharacterized protein n=1 Tax=Ascobolus immersus RN42 TaxID=1160509 RepID=A0A3N4HW79_ASCIM|nr:hypothetical protein BJ508DRAFT_309483 [Ascobolus immersus RN42]
MQVELEDGSVASTVDGRNGCTTFRTLEVALISSHALRDLEKSVGMFITLNAGQACTKEVDMQMTSSADETKCIDDHMLKTYSRDSMQKGESITHCGTNWELNTGIIHHTKKDVENDLHEIQKREKHRDRSDQSTDSGPGNAYISKLGWNTTLCLSLHAVLRLQAFRQPDTEETDERGC